MTTELIRWPGHGWVPAAYGAEGDEDAAEPDDVDEEIRDPKAKIKSLTEANARLARKNEKLFKALEDAVSANGSPSRTRRPHEAEVR